MEHLFDHWPEFIADVSESHLLLLADYDGTLTPIVSRPENAVLSPEVKQALQALGEKPGISVGVVSGRGLADVKRLVGITGIYYAGNHGMEIEGPGLAFVSPEAERARSLMRELAGRLAEALQNTAGVIVEDKGLGLSVHYRLVREDEVAGVEAAFNRITAELADAGRVKITAGKKVLEARPPLDWHKGKAVQVIAEQLRANGELTTVYLGDDLTDEDAFKVLQPPRGWSVYVGGESTASVARYYLDSPKQVSELLSRVLEIK